MFFCEGTKVINHLVRNLSCFLYISYRGIFSNLVATRAFVLSEGETTREWGPVACSTIVMQLHVFQHGRNCMSSNLVANRAFVLSAEERGQLHVTH